MVAGAYVGLPTSDLHAMPLVGLLVLNDAVVELASSVPGCRTLHMIRSECDPIQRFFAFANLNVFLKYIHSSLVVGRSCGQLGAKLVSAEGS